MGLEGGEWRLQVLHHDVLVRYQAVHAVVPALPPVLGGPVVQQEGRALLEGQLAGTAAHVVELGDGLALLQLCEDENTGSHSTPGTDVKLHGNAYYCVN